MNFFYPAILPDDDPENNVPFEPFEFGLRRVVGLNFLLADVARKHSLSCVAVRWGWAEDCRHILEEQIRVDALRSQRARLQRPVRIQQVSSSQHNLINPTMGVG